MSLLDLKPHYWGKLLRNRQQFSRIPLVFELDRLATKRETSAKFKILLKHPIGYMSLPSRF